MKKNTYFKDFKGKKIVITGHTGFKGSWLSLWLNYLGANVYGISNNFKINQTNFSNFKMKKNIKNFDIDIRNFDKLNKLIKKIKPNFIFHFAAQSLVGASYKNPLYNFETNFNGTLNLLEVLRLSNFKCVSIMITSDKSYRNFEIKRGYVEDDILGGDDPYSASKSCAEFVINSYFRSFLKNKKNLSIAVCRAGNVIGGGDWSNDRLIPDLMRSIFQNKKVKLRNQNSTRPWQHVLDVLNGYLILARRLKKNKKFNGQAFNFGPPKSTNFRVLDVVREIKKNWKILEWKLTKRKYHESTLLKLNSNKSLQSLKWKNKLKFKEVIKLVADWYKCLYENKNIYNFSINQIKYFEKK
jgi:CDP-glucose 4,6-dehydratase